MHDILCVLSVRLLWSGKSYLFPFLFVDVLKFTPHKLQFFFESNFVKLQMLWISWKCDAICTIAFPCMTFYVCITCELICSAERACALLPQSYPFLFSKEEKRVNVRAIEFFTKLVSRIFQWWKTSSSSTWKGILNLLRSTGVLWKHEAGKGE